MLGWVLLAALLTPFVLAGLMIVADRWLYGHHPFHRF